MQIGCIDNPPHLPYKVPIPPAPIYIVYDDLNLPRRTMNYQLPLPQSLPAIIRRVVQTIDRYGMFVSHDRVLVGVSGGPDSMALLHILITLAPYYGIDLTVAHLNHGLRSGTAEKDAAFVQHAAEKLGLHCYLDKIAINTHDGSIEERAREARYAFFNDLMDKNHHTKIALGHQKNDNAEAVLMHLLRGSGIRGLGGIPPMRDGRVVRPLIQLGRNDIVNFLREHQIPFVEDATNADPSFTRNRIRHRLIPLLENDYNSNIIDILHRTADLCREDDTWLNRHLQPLLDETITKSEDNHLELHLHTLRSEPVALQRRLVRDALRRWLGHIRRMRAGHIDAVVELLSPEAHGKRVSLPYGIEAHSNDTRLHFVKGGRCVSRNIALNSGFSYSVPGIESLPMTVAIPDSNCRLTFEMSSAPQPEGSALRDKDRAWFDLDKVSFPLHVRNFRPGDRISPYGMAGSQKVKKLFINRKIPLAQRPRIPLLECQGSILWVAGVRRSNRAVVTTKTERILGVRLMRAS